MSVDDIYCMGCLIKLYEKCDCDRETERNSESW